MDNIAQAPPAAAPSPASAIQAPVIQPVPSPDVKPDQIPYARFKEVNDELKSLKDEKTAREVAEQKTRDEKLKKEGEFKLLFEQKEAEIDRLKKVETEFNTVQKSIRDSALAKLTDDKLRDVAADLSTPKLLEFVDLFHNKTASPGSPKGAPVDSKAGSLQPNAGESPQAYAERMRATYRKGDK
jgi:hypothetical protein